MSLTPAQIDLLPPEQKAQVIALQTQMVSLTLAALRLHQTVSPCSDVVCSCCKQFNT